MEGLVFCSNKSQKIRQNMKPKTRGVFPLWRLGLAMLVIFLGLNMIYLLMAVQQENCSKRPVGLRSSSGSYGYGTPSANAWKSAVSTEERQVRTPVGTFNGVPIYRNKSSKSSPLPTTSSTIRCAGENYQKTSWQARSCQYTQICFDVHEQDLVVFETTASRERRKVLTAHLKTRNPFWHVSSLLDDATQSVSLGSLNPNWSHRFDDPRLRWFPRVIEVPPEQQQSSLLDGGNIYELPDHIVLAPYHSMAGTNPGHLVWDDFMPLFTLMELFQFPWENHQILPIRMQLPLVDGKEKGLWGSCEFNEMKKKGCRSMLKKFGSLLVGASSKIKITSNRDFDLQFDSDICDKNPRYICAKSAVAGIGMLSDHGTKSHGWNADDYKYSHNNARGGTFYRMRNQMLANLGLPITMRPIPSEVVPPAASLSSKIQFRYDVIFSINSSGISHRKLDFEKQREAIEANVPNANVYAYQMSNFTMKEQARATSRAAVYVTVCGGGAMTAMLLPTGANVFLFYRSDGGMRGQQKSDEPARLDWDFFNHLSHVKAHWMPFNTMDEPDDIQFLTLLIQHELETLADQDSESLLKRKV